jgi:nucleolar protein 56
VLAIGDKSRLTDDDVHDIAAVVDDDEGIATAIIKAARTSMGRDLSEADMEIVMAFAKRTASLAAYRKQLSNYLGSRMNQVAPNLAALIGDTVGARLISKAGSLTNLSKYPASTVQILGAEKALFRALKTKGNTPKYNKCSIASRIDNFSETPTSKFGEALKRQVDERIEFYASGAPPAKNSAVMQAAMNAVLSDIGVADPTATATEDVEMADGVTAAATEQAIRKEKKDKKEKKKEKKSKHTEDDVSDKKSKKDKKRKADEDEGESKKKKKSKS